jgi:hypothetical protein
MQAHSKRGSTRRAEVLDLQADWRAKAGRESGPDTYVAGDYVSSVMRMTQSLSLRERDAAYGGACVLVGLVESQELRNGSREVTAAYVTVVPLDGEGAEMASDKTLSRTIAGTDTPRCPQWDEVYCVGQRCHIEDATALRFKVSPFTSPDRLHRLCSRSHTHTHTHTHRRSRTTTTR